MQPSQSHQVLARKWRPRNFESLVGQDTVVRALRHALDNDRLHHAYLLTGTRGVGKTTIARILAKALNCETGISSRPCGKCSACVGVDEGHFPDYMEMDAASNRKVEEMAVVLENAAYSPGIGRFKVFVIDEVHMLTNHAFNAMLKTLEEPPPHVVFVLATTDPQKVPVTVLSRCMQFGLRNMSAAAVTAHLERVLAAEEIVFEAPALSLIAQAAAGSMRDALSLLDQAIALGGGSVALESVREMLGAVDTRVVAQLLNLLAQGNSAELIALVDEMAAANMPFGQILMALARVLQRIALVQLDPALAVPAVDADEADATDAAAVSGLAGQLAAEDVQVWYQVAIHGVRDLPLAPDPQTGFVMTLIRMLAFQSASRESAAHTAGPSAAPVSRSAKQSAPSGIGAAQLPAAVTAQPAAIARPAATAQPAATTQRAATAQPAAAQRTATGAGGVTLSFEGDWSSLTAGLPGGGAARQFLQESELLGIEGTVLRLRVPLKPLMDPAIVARVTEILSNRFGTQVRLAVTLGATGEATAAAKANQVRRQRQTEAQEAINNDPFVRKLVDGFGATIMPDSIKPLEGDAG